MRISDWSSDVCSSDLGALQVLARIVGVAAEPVSVGVDHALGRVEQALASRIVASPAQQGTHRVLGLPAADAVALFVSVGPGFAPGGGCAWSRAAGVSPPTASAGKSGRAMAAALDRKSTVEGKRGG